MPEPKHQGLSMLPMSKVLISLLDWLLCLFQEWRQETQTIQPPNKYVTQLERKKVKVLVTQSCLTLCDTMDCSPPGCSVHGILQARILEWVAISFSRGSSHPGIEPTFHAEPCIFCIGRWVIYQLSYWGSPSNFMLLTNSFKILEL